MTKTEFDDELDDLALDFGENWYPGDAVKFKGFIRDLIFRVASEAIGDNLENLESTIDPQYYVGYNIALENIRNEIGEVVRQ